MGGQESKQNTAKYGQIYIKTEKPYYMAGETITGNIYINLISWYPGNELLLKVKARERVNWASHAKNFNAQAINKQNAAISSELGLGHSHLLSEIPDGLSERYDKKSIVKFRVPLYRWQSNTIPPGQFVFPFAFVIPQNVPGSFYYLNQFCRAEIKYVLLAKLLPAEASVQALRYEHEFFVKEHVLSEIQPIQKDITQHVTQFCCISKGRATVKIHVSKNAYVPGEVASLAIETDTVFLKVPIKAFHCKLKQRIILRALKYNETREREIVLGEQILEGVEIGSRPRQDNNRFADFKIPLENEGNKPSFLEEKKIFKGTVDATTRKYFSPSCKGHAVECFYYFEVHPLVSTFCCGRGFSIITIPFQVYAPLLVLDEQHVNPPPNWNPERMPQTNFSIGASSTHLNPQLNFSVLNSNNNNREMNQRSAADINQMNYAPPQDQGFSSSSNLLTNQVAFAPTFNRETFGRVASISSPLQHQNSPQASWGSGLKETPHK